MHHADDRVIENVLSDYCDYVDRYDVDGVLSLFTRNAEYDLGFGRIFVGEQLRAMFSRVEIYRATSHHISNIRIEVDESAGVATVRCALYAYHVRRADVSEAHVWGQYADRFVRHGGAWLIQRRALRVAHEVGTRPEDGHDSLFEYLPRGVAAD